MLIQISGDLSFDSKDEPRFGILDMEWPYPGYPNHGSWLTEK